VGGRQCPYQKNNEKQLHELLWWVGKTDGDTFSAQLGWTGHQNTSGDANGQWIHNDFMPGSTARNWNRSSVLVAKWITHHISHIIFFSCKNNQKQQFTSRIIHVTV